ncbi:MAG: helix-turn-helix domain-containing protein [Bacteroidales bacterium]|nr:helix-turn-helix domain-containing protein [Bacteroidales bacterium]
MMHIGKRIKQVMDEQGRSASWLADNIHCERSNVYYIYRRSTIDTELLKKICTILNYDFFKELSEDVFEQKED